MITGETAWVIIAATHVLAVILGWALTIIGQTIADWRRDRAERKAARALAAYRDAAPLLEGEPVTATLRDLAPEVLRPDDHEAAGLPADTLALRAARAIEAGEMTPVMAAIRGGDQLTDGRPPVYDDEIRTRWVFAATGTGDAPGILGPGEVTGILTGAVDDRIAALIAKADGLLTPEEDWDALAAQARGGPR